MKFWNRKESKLLEEKLNPAQAYIHDDQGESVNSSYRTYTYKVAYNNIEVVNRGTNLITESAAAIKVDVGDTISSITPVRSGMRVKKLISLMNYQPNPYQDADSFYRYCFMDLILEGNIFIYYDGVHLYHLPAYNVEVISDKKTFINSYKYDGEKTFQANEIIHVKENSSVSIFRGRSRLESANSSIETLGHMLNFQKGFFKNSAVPGLVLRSPNALGARIKERILSEWTTNFNPKTGGRKPILLDGDLTIDKFTEDYSTLEFSESVKDLEQKILEALGVPEVLLTSGNNANINPNLRMFYLNTILPTVEKLHSAMQVFFGFDLSPITQDVQALRPELQDISNYLTSLTNAGIITRNEARESLRYVKVDDEEADNLILPANVAGSAVDPSQGGAPPKPDEDNEDKKLRLVKD